MSPSWTGNGRTKDHWRQTDVRIEGPVVASLQSAFVENWLEATGTVLGGEAYFPRLAPHGTVTAQVVHSSPAEGSFCCPRPSPEGERRNKSWWLGQHEPSLAAGERTFEITTRLARSGGELPLGPALFAGLIGMTVRSAG